MAFERRVEAGPYEQGVNTDWAIDRARGRRAESVNQTVPKKSVYARSSKRGFDVLFALAFMLLIGCWLLPLIGLLIKLDSRGTVFFIQRRVGEGGGVFRCIKFRTMVHDPQAAFVQARKNDPRITRVGAFLRKTNLDELPQFINVLRGDMSVVGPRPHVPELDDVFGAAVPGYTARTVVRPGITGLAQVSGCRGETKSIREMTHRIRFDLFYAKNMSLRMDLKVIVLTVLTVLRGDERAY
ncbi:sugar transferase [Algiphilus sp. W345]|uniref:Sugar transferase n=1 Tax=Banduia mediterranea TaxID=3075609 RepID=A0ABU2WFQ8_9GAMM|nr:sugar transferase [Algiphilus sp. W345]MDT0496360.1 sugar transferase [Algiphilus sp. W345]